MDDIDPAALARRLASAHSAGEGNASFAPEPLVKPEDVPLVKTNLRPSQVPTPPPEPPAPEPAPTPAADNPISNFSSTSDVSISPLATAGTALPGHKNLSPKKTSLDKTFSHSATSAPALSSNSSSNASDDFVLLDPTPKKVGPHQPKNIPALVLLSTLGVLILAGLGYFVYFYYLSDSFSPTKTAQTPTSEQSQTSPTENSAQESSITPTSENATPTETPESAESSNNASNTSSESSENSEAPQSSENSATPSQNLPVSDEGKIFSRLSGEEIASRADDSAPTFCVQIPNGLDGGRPQIGLTDAKIIFEAISEAGITRFAAVFQNPPRLIGPIRSLRIYYLNWDTPFDCIIVHAGGADDAIASLRINGYRELDESRDYMFRINSEDRRWNNLFATGEDLKAFAQNQAYLSSEPNSFPRLTPQYAHIAKIKAQATHPLVIDEPADGDTSELKPQVTKISFRFGEMPTFNPIFTYDPATNSYLRSYESGAAHNVLDCSNLAEDTLKSIQNGSSLEAACDTVQLSPTIVIAMVVQEQRAAYDSYHEDISSIGTGAAYIFQNGGVIEGSWEKATAGSQIVFRDSNGEELDLVPGQTWISAIPTYGSVEFE